MWPHRARRGTVCAGRCELAIVVGRSTESLDSTKMTHRIRDIDALYDFIGYVVVSAPDRFPKEDYLSDHEQMNLERAFAELRHGIALVESDFPGADRTRGLSKLLDDAYSSYLRGDEVKGAHFLHDFERQIFKR